MIILTEKDTGTHISIKTGEQLRINLPSNISTGYNWLVFPGSYLERISPASCA